MQFLLSIYRFIFCRSLFHRFNYHVQRVSLRGIGVLNSEGNEVTGESHVLRRLSKVENMNVFVDVGANTGGYTDEILTHFPTAKVYAIEPHPKTFLKLKKNITSSRSVLWNGGLGDKTGKGQLWDFADDAMLKHTQPTSTLASTVKEVIEEFHQQKAQAFTFPITTLDAYTEKENITRIDLLKIDTEGNELQVLQGASKLIQQKKIRYIQFEFNEMNVYARTYFKDFMDLLPEYTFFRLMPRGLYPMGRYKPSTHELFAFQNILAVPEREVIP